VHHSRRPLWRILKDRLSRRHDGEGLGDSGDDMLKLWGVKLMIDGGVETAFLRDPYEVIAGEQEDPEYRGVAMMSRPELYKLCREAAKNGWRLGIHTVGDAAMDMVLDVFDEVNREFSIVGRRWSIMHGFLVRPEHFQIMRRLGVTWPAAFPTTIPKAMPW